MAAASKQDIHLKAMGEAENPTERPDEAGRAGIF